MAPGLRVLELLWGCVRGWADDHANVDRWRLLDLSNIFQLSGNGERNGNAESRSGKRGEPRDGGSELFNVSPGDSGITQRDRSGLFIRSMVQYLRSRASEGAALVAQRNLVRDLLPTPGAALAFGAECDMELHGQYHRHHRISGLSPAILHDAVLDPVQRRILSPAHRPGRDLRGNPDPTGRSVKRRGAILVSLDW